MRALGITHRYQKHFQETCKKFNDRLVDGWILADLFRAFGRADSSAAADAFAVAESILRVHVAAALDAAAAMEDLAFHPKTQCQLHCHYQQHYLLLLPIERHRRACGPKGQNLE